MKKVTVAVLVLALGFIACAQAQQVLSRNAVGYVRLDVVANAWVLVNSTFEKLDGTLATVTDVVGTNVANGSIVLVWNGSAYVGEEFIGGYGWDPGTNVLVRGSGFWLKSPVTTNLYVMGEVPDDTNTVVNIPPGYRLISFPYPVAKQIGDTVLNTTANNGDQILGLNGSGGYDGAEFIGGYGWDPPEFLLEPGKGYWYKSTRGATTNWNEPKPYTWP